ncbi:HNH endonuclease [Polynucleobacter sp. MWH-Adler-W8]|uniref:HNH endonuclease n=1 Tax=Polynucleobacter sp. MWH-Adler-W8 TaxID=1819727 RepID=UPI000927A8C0|nr:HNH endonuclease [Polynucleobacter sp. MWH-Adler-W8]OJI04523.1 hypothetical protein AOC28_08225 [Polynucleobacter sp. MWH-Adler-W8]
MAKAKGISNPLPTPDRLRELFFYPSAMGKLYNLKTRSPNAYRLEEAGTLHHTGYLYVSIDKKSYGVHRIIWVMRHGKDIPKGYEIDHIDGNKSNNHIDNLRLATRAENMQNKSKRIDGNNSYKGVHHRKISGRYSASITYNGEQIALGNYDSALEAAAFYDAAAIKFHGKFARHNNTGIDRSKELEDFLANPLTTRNKSGYRGVSWSSRRNIWRAQFKRKGLGYFATKEEAALAYNEAAKRLHGEFACLNVIPETPRLGRSLGEQLTLFDSPKEKAQTWGMGFLSNTY